MVTVRLKANWQMTSCPIKAGLQFTDKKCTFEEEQYASWDSSLPAGGVALQQERGLDAWRRPPKGDFSPSFLKSNRCCLLAVTWPLSLAPKIEQEKRVKINSCHFILDLMTLLKSSFTSRLLARARVPPAADYNLRSSSSAYRRRNGRWDNYLDDAKCEMSICARTGFTYLTFFTAAGLQRRLRLDLRVENVKSSQTGGFIKAAGEVNRRWPFKQCGHMATRWSSVNPPQLLWYAPRVPTAGFLLLQAFVQLGKGGEGGAGHAAANRLRAWAEGPDRRVPRSPEWSAERWLRGSELAFLLSSQRPCTNAEAICGLPQRGTS